MMPLAMANKGEEQLIKKVGGKEETRLFLEKLGFVPGSKVSVEIWYSNKISIGFF